MLTGKLHLNIVFYVILYIKRYGYVDEFFLLLFWKDDESPGFEKTDAAVEKSVNLAFDLIGKGAVDSFIDFAKFLYQSKSK